MPPAGNLMFSNFRSLLASGPYAPVFGALGAEGALAVAPPSPAVLVSAGLARARGSLVKGEGLAPSCSHRIEGSGFVYAPGHLLTHPHLVAGVTQCQDVFTTRNASFSASVALFDPH